VLGVAGGHDVGLADEQLTVVAVQYGPPGFELDLLAIDLQIVGTLSVGAEGLEPPTTAL
jgi:hypothetical protein